MKCKYCFMRFPQGKPKALTLSYDDGVQQDEKLIGLMEKYGFKGTFNVSFGCICPEGKVYAPGRVHRPMTLNEMKRVYDTDCVEIAIHGFNHPYLERLAPSVAMREVYDDRVNLEREFGGVIRGMAYPYGTYNDQVVDILRGCGVRYARTTQSTRAFDLPQDWLRLHPTCHHKDPRLMELAEEFASMQVKMEPKLFYLWGHSYEFEQVDNWNVIEEFFEAMTDKEDIWYATNIEIYDYIKAFERLQFSCNGKRAFNPSAMDVWVAYGESDVCIPAGKTIELE